MEAVLSTKASRGAVQTGAKAASGAAPAPLLIDNRFRVVGGVTAGFQQGGAEGELAGLAAFEARDNRSSTAALLALRADPEMPLRAQLPDFIPIEHDGLIVPLAHGGAGGDYWVVCTAPAGPSFASLASPWRGNSLLVHVLRPIASVLDQLQLHGLTHRSIRPDNLFPAADLRSAVLGPAWSGPPAARQPCVFEPVSSAICAPEARGQGTIADDVYALGVLILALWTGEVPLAGRTPREIVQLKLDLGSHAALTGSCRLPRNLDELLRTMLADDAIARPGPGSLINLDIAQTRRGAARAAPRASRPIVLGTATAWNRRSLAFEAAAQPRLGLAAFRDGAIELWLRRHTEDGPLAAKFEELRHSDHAASHGGSAEMRPSLAAGDDMALMRLIALLDPLAPLFYQGVWLWPDGLGTILAASLASRGRNPGRAGELLDALLLRGLAQEWQAVRPQQQWCAVPTVPQSLLLHRLSDDPQSVLSRAAYWLNPLLPCVVPYAGLDRAASLAALLLALEKAASVGGLAAQGAKQGAAGSRLLDPSMRGFVAARQELIAPAKDASVAADPDERFRDLAILARSQRSVSAGPLPALATVLLDAVEPLVQDWPGLSRRAERQKRLAAAAAEGDLRGMLALIDDPAKLRQDELAREQAAALLIEMQEHLAARISGLPARLEAGRLVARDTAVATGLCSVTASLLYELLR